MLPTTVSRTIILCILIHMCAISAQQQIPNLHKSTVQLKKTINVGFVAAQWVAGLIKSLDKSFKETQVRGKAKRAEESMQDKKIAAIMVIVPFMAGSSFFLRGLERFGITKKKIDELVKQMELTKLTRLMKSHNWVPTKWWGLSGGLSQISRYMGGRLAGGIILNEARDLKKNIDNEKLSISKTVN